MSDVPLTSADDGSYERRAIEDSLAGKLSEGPLHRGSF